MKPEYNYRRVRAAPLQTRFRAQQPEARLRPGTAAHWIRMRLGVLPLAMLMLSAAPPKGVSIHTRDSLSLRQASYSSLFFVAEPARTPDSNMPVQYHFTESGVMPHGMKFESYPCNKPNSTVCPQVATANGIFLDGTPAETGSYTFVITASDTDGRRASQQFTVVVNPSDHRK